jgi:hypothetical protein
LGKNDVTQGGPATQPKSKQSRVTNQGTLTEGEGSVPLTSSLGNLFCKKSLNYFQIKKQLIYTG